MKILITGITGLLGYTLQGAADSQLNLFGTYFPERDLPIPFKGPVKPVNIADRKGMEALFEEVRPDVVIHTAGIGSVDFAESNREIAREINVGGTLIVADLCKKRNTYLVYISSNAVFDGNTPPYDERAPVNPINYYGKLKVEAEELVKNGKINSVIVRPILMFGWHYPAERENPVTWWIKSLRQGLPLKVVDNVYSRPLYAGFCADVIWKIISKNSNGIFHIAGYDHVSLYQFAVSTAEEFGLNSSLIEPVPDSYFPEIAPRPRDTSFDTGKIESELGMTPPSLRECLKHMRHLEKDGDKVIEA